MATQSTTNPSLSRRWENYQPSKTMLVWACIAAAIATIVVGFSWGGWVLGSTADKRVAATSEQAVAQFAANICVNRFLSAADAKAELAKLKTIESWKQDTFIEEGGWATFASAKTPIEGVAEICANKLASSTAPAHKGGA